MLILRTFIKYMKVLEHVLFYWNIMIINYTYLVKETMISLAYFCYTR